MSFIQMISETEASGDLADAYWRIAGARGGVANVLKVHSLNPPALVAHFDLYRKIMFSRSPLKRPLREMIGVVVSAANRCAYCVAHHSEPLFSYKIEAGLIDTLRAGLIPESGLTPAEQAILHYAQRLTLAPATEEAAINKLKEAGWDDRSVLDATLVTSYFNFVNRLVIALGVELEPDFEQTCAPEIVHSP